MGLLNYLTFDGVESRDFGVYISGDGVFDAPARRGEMIQIPGRNGSLFMDEGVFENIEVEYPAFIGEGDEATFRTKLSALRAELTSRGNYKRLADTYHPDEFRLAVYREGLEVDPEVITRAGEFTLKFDCKPQRYLISGEDPIVLSEGAMLYNPTLFNAKPLIKVIGNGKVRIEPYEFIVKGNTGELWIDSELLETYKLVHFLYDLTDEVLEIIRDENGEDIEVSREAVPESSEALVEFVNYVYPEIAPGYVPVWISQGIEELTIIPRWWTL